jgi:serine/threonine-protein kinase
VNVVAQPPGPRPKLSGAAAASAEHEPTFAYSAGDVIASKYRLTSVLGEGGMGSVWLAHNLALEVDVAVKLIRHGMASSDASLRLLQEARAAARLEHPSIVRVFDFGETEHKDPFIVMELLRGESLGELLDRKGRLAAHHAVRILLPIASALAVAHDKDIVHRDLKPDNVFLAKTDLGGVVPKIVDFGIAKLKRDPAARHTTQAGVVLGSPDYMSPEQARGKGEVDEASDIWALAVVLYESVTGHRPFGGDNYNEQISAILLDDPEPTTEFSAGDEALWKIIERGLAKNRAQRWPTMREFGRALAEWAVSRGISADVCGTSLVEHWLANVEHSFSDSATDSSLLIVPAARASLSSIPPSPNDPLSTPAGNPRDSLANALHAELPSFPAAVRSRREMRRDATPMPSVDEPGDVPAPVPARSSWPLSLGLLALLAGGVVTVFFYGARIRAAAPWLPLPDIAATNPTADPPPADAEGGLAAGAAEPIAIVPPAAPIDELPAPIASASASAAPVASTPGGGPMPSAARPVRGPWPPRAATASARPTTESPDATAPAEPPSPLKNPFE